MTETTTERRTALERALGLVTEVRRGEAPLALAMALNVFILLTAYSVIKPVREALILGKFASGAEYKSYMSAAIAVALLAAVPAYARFVDRLPRLRLVVGVTLFFASHLVIFFIASRVELLRHYMGLVFFVWIGVFNMMVVAQFWAFANDVYDEEQGKRLFALVALGASFGAALGSGVAALLVGPFGVFAPLLVGAALLVVCAFLFAWSERLSTAFREQQKGAALAATSPGGELKRKERPKGAFALVMRHRYLFAIALFALVFSWANSNSEYMLSKLVKAAANEAVRSGTLPPGMDAGDYIGLTYAQFNFGVNTLSLLLQGFVVSRIIKHGGVGLGLIVLPIITLMNGVAVLALPVLAVLRIGKTLENATDYSLNNTARQMLWLPTSYEMKFKAKQAVDTFFVRLGDVSSSALVLVGTSLLAWSVRAYAFANVLLGAVWIFLVWRIRREGRRLERARPASGEPSTEGAHAISDVAAEG
jgi:AAA family ATP:ADP antiporter